LSQTISQTDKASLQLFSVRLICSVIINTLQINGTLNTPTFYHSNKTNTRPFGSWFKPWNILEKSVIVLFCWKRQPGIATYLLVYDYLMQRFPNFFRVGTTFISQNVLRTTLLLSPLKANCLRFSTTVYDTQFTLILFFLSFLD
jgi:hypothetical protein